MKLDEKELAVLRNFAAINQNLVLKGSEEVGTLSESRVVLAEAKLPALAEASFGIYDLNEFLATLDLVSEPIIDVHEDYAVIRGTSGVGKIKYYFSDPKMLTTPTKKIEMPSVDVTFKLSRDLLERVKKAKAVLGHEILSLRPDGKNLVLSVLDPTPTNATSNAFSIDVPGEFDEGEEFNLLVKIEYLKMIPGDYDVEVSKRLIARLTNDAEPVTYYVSLEKDSKWK